MGLAVVMGLNMTEPPFIEAKNLRRSYTGAGAGSTVVALGDFSLKLEKGVFLAVTGPSGCGKSTFLNLLAALDTPDAGFLRVGDFDLTDSSEAARTRYRRECVGVVFQFFHLMPGLTVEENVALPLRLRGTGRRDRLERARELLDFVGLDARRSHHTHQLSGGETQRAAVARALVHRPALVVADEPTGNLDSAAAERVLDVFAKIREQRQTTLVMATHSMEIAAMADETLRISDGHRVD